METLPPYKDEALAIVHLLGGRYGYEKRYGITMEEDVAQAIKVFGEIREQLRKRDQDQRQKEIDLTRRVRQ
jgi:hypothetical protein